MQLNIQPQQNFQPQVGQGPGDMQAMQAASQYHGVAYVNVGQPMQQLTPQQQQPINNGLNNAGVVLGQGSEQQHMQGGIITEHRQHPTGAETETAYEVKTPPLPANQTARLEIGMGFTKNIGDYQSFKANVSVQLPWPVNDIQGGLNECQRIALERMRKMWAEG